MKIRKEGPILGALLAMMMASACQDMPTQTGSAMPDATTDARIDSKAGTRSTLSEPDFTRTYRDMIPGVVVTVRAYRIDARTWRVEITVVRCEGDMCVATWREAIYTIPPTDPLFESTVCRALDDDSDGIWNWEERIGIDYQE